MATDTSANVPAVATKGWKPYRLSVDQFLAMIDAGIFHPAAHVELVGGILVQMMTKGNPHSYTIDAIAEDLRRLIPEGWRCRDEKPLQVARRSRPEPDVSVIRGPRDLYRNRTPHARETALVVEVSQSTYAYDRGEKWRMYAAARIPAYWIVNLEKAQVEVYSDPIGRGKAASYPQTLIYGIDAQVPVIVDGVEVGRVAVKDVLP